MHFERPCLELRQRPKHNAEAKALSRCCHGVVGILLLTTAEVLEMRYILAWALGVPFSVIVLWYIVAHAGC